MRGPLNRGPLKIPMTHTSVECVPDVPDVPDTRTRVTHHMHRVRCIRRTGFVRCQCVCHSSCQWKCPVYFNLLNCFSARSTQEAQKTFCSQLIMLGYKCCIPNKICFLYRVRRTHSPCILPTTVARLSSQ